MFNLFNHELNELNELSEMDYQFLKVEQPQEGICLLKISAPKSLNALNSTILREMDDFVGSIDSHTRVLIITGDGEKSFVAGADISEMAHLNEQEGFEFGRLGAQVFRKIEQLPIPVIAAVNGFALGGGCELAMACDIRIASTRAKMGIPEASLGVIPGFGGTQRLPRLVGLSRAIELLATGRPCGAEECREMGLVDRVAEPEGLMDACMELAETISRNSATAIAHGKQCMRAGLERELGEALELEQRVFAMNFTEADQREGMSAFLEKRPAAFR